MTVSLFNLGSSQSLPAYAQSSAPIIPAQPSFNGSMDKNSFNIGSNIGDGIGKLLGSALQAYSDKQDSSPYSQDTIQSVLSNGAQNGSVGPTVQNAATLADSNKSLFSDMPSAGNISPFGNLFNSNLWGNK